VKLRLFLIFVSILGISCTGHVPEGVTREEKKFPRIESIKENGYITLFIYEGHVYLTRYYGGIIHSESCPHEGHVR